ncbi:MAG: GumC family protein, partial [Xanthobacteraceae bacterium]
MSETSRPGPPPRAGDAEFDFPALGAALWRGKWKILRPTLLVALVALAVVQVIPPKYLSESRILIESRDNIFLRPDADKDLIDRNTVDDETVTSQVQLVLSRDLARDVIAKLDLEKKPEFNPALNGISPIKIVFGRLGLIKDPSRMTPEERVLEAYYDRLTVYAIDKSHVIVIDFLSHDPELAAKVANTIADEYLARQRTAKQDQARIAVKFYSGEIETLQKKVADAEAKVAAFTANSNLLQGPNNTTLSAQQLGDINAQLAGARAQEADAEAKAKIIRQMLNSGQPIESSDILNSELILRLSEQRVTLRAELAEQSISLGARHPRIKELKAQIADLDQQIRAEATSIARSFENDAKIASARVDSLTAAFDQIKTQAAGSNERDVELRALQRDAKAQRDLLESYLAKY